MILIRALFGLVLLCAAGLSAGAEQAAVPQSAPQMRLTFAPLVADAAPAVVNIYTRREVARSVPPLFDDPMFRRFFGPRFGPDGPFGPRVQNTLGSGVILRSDGLVVTNHHVIDGAEEVRVVLSDRSEHAADIVLIDPQTDLAFLQLDAVDGALPVLDLADSDAVQVGDLVLAIGNPFGVGQTITLGIVSAQARSAAGIADFNFFIQTDAAINPGNSGGALIDIDGRVVGINTAIFSRTGGSLGIGFAVPSNMVGALLNSLDRGRPGVRPWLGAEAQTVDQRLVDAAGLDRPVGALVTRVMPDSPAARAGVRPGDVILSVDGLPVDSEDGLRYRIATLPLDGTASLSVWRDGTEQALTLQVEPPLEQPPRQTTTLTDRHPLTGATVENLSPALIADRGYSVAVDRGVVVLSVHRDTPAARLGLEPGDVVRSINGRAIDDVGGLLDALAQDVGIWRIVTQRGDRLLQTVIAGGF